MTLHVRVAVGSERYGIAVDCVREVAELGRVVPVPGAGHDVLGLCHLHGDLLPVVQLSDLLRCPAGDPRRIVVVEHGGRRAGLVVDAAEEVEELPAADGGGAPLTRGAVLHDGRHLGLLDVAALLDAVQAKAA